MILDHIGLSVRDFGRSATFFRRALAPLRDCLLLALWCVALVRRTVVWRGNRRRIGRGTVLVRLAPALEAQRANSQAY